MADASQNNPKKEFLFALIGVGLFLGIVLLIGISGFLRPAAQHITVEVLADKEVVASLAVTSAATTAIAETETQAQALL